ncbi:hypothetical protein DNTS_023052 [Danionella cerebrum]|uniref:CBM21 domain-containing protein n=1 Tax=Danionella cerebrum TaxID=2873325 RepID=A0A553Q5B6_9TELE|nr:hypothetical protein DNTS_023052 [Danionella translucida]
MDVHPPRSEPPISRKAPIRTFHLQHIYNPKLPPQRSPVPIRPPSPNPSSQRPPPDATTRRKPFCEPEPKPIMRRRARSVPNSAREEPCRRTRVRFVDSLGLELEDVKLFRAGEDPAVPPHIITKLLASAEMASRRKLELSLPYFQPSFPDNLSGEPGYLQRLSRQKVCLEQLLCSDLGITGTVQVVNVAYEKEVSVRYSFTDWKSRAECRANWVSSQRTDDLELDRFRFLLPVPPFIMEPGARLQFAICFRANSSEYWDNNGGGDYTLSCQTYSLTVPRECEASLLHFT